MTNSDKADLARKIHIRAMIALIDQFIHNDGPELGRMIKDLMAADVATFNPTKQGDRITIYGVLAVTILHDNATILRAWQVAARKFLETR